MFSKLNSSIKIFSIKIYINLIYILLIYSLYSLGFIHRLQNDFKECYIFYNK